MGVSCNSFIAYYDTIYNWDWEKSHFWFINTSTCPIPFPLFVCILQTVYFYLVLHDFVLIHGLLMQIVHDKASCLCTLCSSLGLGIVGVVAVSYFHPIFSTYIKTQFWNSYKPYTFSFVILNPPFTKLDTNICYLFLSTNLFFHSMCQKVKRKNPSFQQDDRSLHLSSWL